MGQERDELGRIVKGSVIGAAHRFRPGHRPANKGVKGGGRWGLEQEAPSTASRSPSPKGGGSGGPEIPAWLRPGEPISLDEALIRDFEMYGAETIVRLRQTRPEAWLKAYREAANRRVYDKGPLDRMEPWERDALAAEFARQLDLDDGWLSRWHEARAAEWRRRAAQGVTRPPASVWDAGRDAAAAATEAPEASEAG